jgi:hypothetical protein
MQGRLWLEGFVSLFTGFVRKVSLYALSVHNPERLFGQASYCKS